MTANQSIAAGIPILDKEANQLNQSMAVPASNKLTMINTYGPEDQQTSSNKVRNSMPVA